MPSDARDTDARAEFTATAFALCIVVASTLAGLMLFQL